MGKRKQKVSVSVFIPKSATRLLDGVMLVAGWRTSLIDAPGVALVLWVCGCNLMCPFCHNWRVADGDPEVCSEVGADRIAEEIRSAASIVDYVQVSGGEPLLYADELSQVFAVARRLGLKVSLNSNLTLPSALRKVVDLVDHVATDVKIPQNMYGVEKWEGLFADFLRSLAILSERREVELELRVPVVRAPVSYYASVFSAVREALGDRGNCRVSLRRIYGRPVVIPRSEEWCRTFCADDDYSERAAEVESLARYYFGSCFQTTRQ